MDSVEKCPKLRYIGVFPVDKIVDKKSYLSTGSTGIGFGTLTCFIIHKLSTELSTGIGGLSTELSTEKFVKIRKI